ncbi:asparagine synthase (glutamine-hydrolyzing) [Solidesulfovibrio carbinolicus]|uniref:asparagine synthase (glutamine-hydrolyzing) n=1 Tax=Solidesulfovibrio carbinolicus TaxID=296842 RepID=A0A4P6HQK1_9BACT|nr:asparagine synthase (glutamine-hydrolyzing) [Solidesulfovibrio carbinolicus]QAZ69597.1 asparagine synthase (glutamine-hydrolyzing) [Solidesulfovibrio carbinolicus]
MCGIVGFWQHNGSVGGEELERATRQMTDTLHHRGPDSSGVWCDAKVGVGLGHRRLAILDLTPTGHQPMISKDGRYVLVYNGEIYNAEALRRELLRDGASFTGRSDTEVLLEGCAVWGVEPCLRRVNGMFAFALWDAKERILFLARDHLGIKPLYWGRFGPLFLFGSELKALRRHDGWTPSIDREALAAYVRYCYIPAPRSIYQGVHKLPPGCFLAMGEGAEPAITAYWDARTVALDRMRHRRTESDNDLVLALEHLLLDSAQGQMTADVPLGAFLSGGIDSSLVVSLMQARSVQPVRTFSIGFEESDYNEAPFAKAVAEHLGTVHTECYMTPKDAWGTIPLLPSLYDEPFADSSQLPTYLLSKITRQHVTIALSGDGGDELFAGYSRYFHFLQNYRNPLGTPISKWVQPALRRLPPGLCERVARFVPLRWKGWSLDECVREFFKQTGSGAMEFYQSCMSHWQTPEDLVLGGREPKTVILDRSLEQLVPNHVERMQLLDALTYLPDDILTKVDRASMAVSLEVRVPLLDHRVFEFTWGLPDRMRVRDGMGKWILRQILYKYVPKELVDRPKMGFGVPIDVWLRGPLRDWAESLLDEGRLAKEGYFNPTLVRDYWKRHLEGQNQQYLLWDILMFQGWLETMV